MSTTLTVTAVTATTATIAFTNLPGGGSVEIQIADNPDFRGMFSWQNYAATPAAISGLNQLGTWYARGRTVTAGGVLGAWGAIVGFYTPAAGAWNTAPQPIMIDPAIIVVPEPILGFTNAGAVAGYPASNLGRDDPNLFWVTTNADLLLQTAGAPINTIALLDTFVNEGAVWTIAAGNTAAEANGGAPPFQLLNQTFRASTNLPQRPGYHGLLRLAAPQAYPFWRIVVTGAAGQRQGRTYARYVVLGLARTAKNISTDKLEAPLDLGSMDRTRGGGPDRVWGHKMRKIDFEIAVMREMQWETQFGDLWRKIALSEPVLAVPNSRTGAFLHDRILYGTMAAQRSTNVNSPIFTQGFSIESLI